MPGGPRKSASSCLRDEAAGGELEDEARGPSSVEVEVEGVERLAGVAEAGAACTRRSRSRSWRRCSSSLHERRDEIERRQLLGLGLDEARLEGGGHAREAQLAERAVSFGEVHVGSPGHAVDEVAVLGELADERVDLLEAEAQRASRARGSGARSGRWGRRARARPRRRRRRWRRRASWRATRTPRMRRTPASPSARVDALGTRRRCCAPARAGAGEERRWCVGGVLLGRSSSDGRRRRPRSRRRCSRRSWPVFGSRRRTRARPTARGSRWPIQPGGTRVVGASIST